MDSVSILTGIDGNAYNVMAVTARELKRRGASRGAIDSYREEATSGDYDNLLRVSLRWLDDTEDTTAQEDED